MKTPAHLLLATLASVLAVRTDGPVGRRRRTQKPKAVDKRKRAKRRQAKASRKGNRK